MLFGYVDICYASPGLYPVIPSELHSDAPSFGGEVIGDIANVHEPGM